MAARKQFLHRTEPNAELQAALEKSRVTKVTEEQLQQQRISFAYGNASDSERITKASVTAAAQHIRLYA